MSTRRGVRVAAQPPRTPELPYGERASQRMDLRPAAAGRGAGYALDVPAAGLVHPAAGLCRPGRSEVRCAPRIDSGGDFVLKEVARAEGFDR